MKKLKDIASDLSIIFNSMALGVYPFVLFFNLCVFFNPFGTDYTYSAGWAIQLMIFVVASTLYPIAYITAMVLGFKASSKGNEEKARVWQAWLSLYLVIIILLFCSLFSGTG